MITLQITSKMPQKARKKIGSVTGKSAEKKKKQMKETKIIKSRYENQQLSKIVNSYGGIGSVLQTREGGSLLVEDFANWPVTGRVLNAGGQLKDEYCIIEDRLVMRLRREFFKNIRKLFRLPLTECKYGKTWLKEQNSAISASFFPKYFYCPQCRRLKHLDDWQEGNKIGYPHCGCKGYQKKLEQVRFILVSESGNISDIPWEQLLDNYGRRIEFTTPVQGRRNLFYGTSESAESLSAIFIIEKDDSGNPLKSKNLGYLPNMKFIDQNGEEYLMQLRQSNSLFYIKTVSSIFIPKYVIPVLESQWIEDQIASWKADEIPWDHDKLFSRFKGKFPESKTSKTHITNFLNQVSVQKTREETEDEYRKEEFEYFLNPFEESSSDLSIEGPFSMVTVPIKNLYNLKKLKQVTVQTGYSRVSPESIFVRIGNDNSIYFPAVEMKGEGVLFEFDKEVLVKKVSDEGKTENKSQALKIFVHTFSHIIMKELEFECGYSVSTLKERLYCHFDTENNPVYLGLLIYAVSGSDGSMGGLSSLFNRPSDDDNRFIFKIIRNAMIRARDCPNDPVCIGEADGDSGNAASCYACTLIPETSCEEFNDDIDRRILINVFDAP